MPQALIIEPVHEVLLTYLDKWGYTYKLEKQMSKADALAIMHEYTGLITSNKLYVDKDIIDAGTQLKWIGRMGSGMEIIDVPYAQSKNIMCVSSPEGNANAVAEQALGMFLSMLHHVVKGHQELNKGIWLRDENRGTELLGRKVGIIGYGNNGQLFAQKLMALGCIVYAYDPYVTIEGKAQLIPCTTLDELCGAVQMLSFHVPLNAETKLYFNDDLLAKIHQPFHLINLSRGGVVDLSAVVKGLYNGQILGAAIDVWTEEPITTEQNTDADHFKFIATHPKCIVTPHIGGYSHEATYKMSYYVAEKLKAIHEPQ